MRHRYFHLDPDLLRQLLAEIDLTRLFNQLLLAAGGDPEEAMEWMRYLQEQGYLDQSIDLEAFFAAAREAAAARARRTAALVLSGAGERQIRKSAFEEIFSGLAKGAPGYHADRAPAGEGVEPLPETTPLRLRRRAAPHRLRALAAATR